VLFAEGYLGNAHYVLLFQQQQKAYLTCIGIRLSDTGNDFGIRLSRFAFCLFASLLVVDLRVLL
jgi:hypothetical protein